MREVVEKEGNSEALGNHLMLLSKFPDYLSEVIDYCSQTRKEVVLSPAFHGIQESYGEACLDFYVECLSGKHKFSGQFLQGIAAKAVCKYSKGDHYIEIAGFIRRDIQYSSRFFEYCSPLIRAKAYLFWFLSEDSKEVFWEVVEHLKSHWEVKKL